MLIRTAITLAMGGSAIRHTPLDSLTTTPTTPTVVSSGPSTRLVAIAIKDPRTEYVIWNGYIWSRQYGFRKRVYNGTNKHRTHVHISIRHGASYETSTKRWGYYPVLNRLAVVAREVIDGKWGNGDERKRRLTAAGYNYAAVQAEVNRQLS